MVSAFKVEGIARLSKSRIRLRQFSYKDKTGQE